MAEMIKNETAVTVAKDTQVVSYKTNNGTEIKLTPQIVRDVITNGNSNITDNEIAMFMNVCVAQKSNPFIREAYLVKYDNSKPAQIITGLGYFEKIADSNPVYDGKEDGIIVQRGNDIIERVGCVYYKGETLLGGWCKVYRKDRRFPTISKCMLSEMSKGQSTWKQMQSIMINKCAKVSALRSAFPNCFNGCYIEEEMQSTINNDAENVNANMQYSIPTDSTVAPEIIEHLEPISSNCVSDSDLEPSTDNPNIPQGAIEIAYSEYKDNKDKYEKVDYLNGDKSYNIDNKTMLVFQK